MTRKLKQLTSDGPSVLFLAFQGELIDVYLDSKSQVSRETEDGVEVAEMQLMINGYLVDEDDNYLYLGEAPLQTDRAVSKSRILTIALTKAEDHLTNFLDGVEGPTSDNEIN